MSLKKTDIVKREWFEYREVPYYYMEWTTWDNKPASGYSCEYFNFYPHNLVNLPSKTEVEMKKNIDYLLDNLDELIKKKELEERATSEWVEESRRLGYSTD